MSDYNTGISPSTAYKYISSEKIIEAARALESRRRNAIATGKLPSCKRKSRQSNRLSPRFIETPKPGSYCDGHGLWLVVSRTGAKKWVFRFSFNRRVTEMGLGPLRIVELEQARASAAAVRKMVFCDVNPIEARREASRR